MARGDLERELKKLQRAAKESAAAAVEANSEVNKQLDGYKQFATQTAATLDSTSAQLSELQSLVRALGQRQDNTTRAHEELSAMQQAMKANLSEGQGVLDDLRAGGSLARVWHDQAQTWRDQEQSFEWQTSETLKDLQSQVSLLRSEFARLQRGMGSTDGSGSNENAISTPAAPPAAQSPTDAAATTPPQRAAADKTAASTRESAVAPTVFTPREDATTRRSTEAAQLAHLALPEGDSTEPPPSSTAGTPKGGPTSVQHLASPTSKPTAAENATQPLTEIAQQPAISTQGTAPDSSSSHSPALLVAPRSDPASEGKGAASDSSSSQSPAPLLAAQSDPGSEHSELAAEAQMRRRMLAAGASSANLRGVDGPDQQQQQPTR